MIYDHSVNREAHKTEGMKQIDNLLLQIGQENSFPERDMFEQALGIFNDQTSISSVKITQKQRERKIIVDGRSALECSL